MMGDAMTSTTIAMVRKGIDLPDYSDDPRDRHRLVATVKLHHLTGNERPYFSATADLVNNRYNRNNDRYWESGGCLHDMVLEHFPAWTPLVALHLADDRGWPMHAVANGAYFLGFTKYREHNGKPLPAFDVFARQWRVSEQEARAARAWVPMYEGPAIDAMGVLALAMAPRWQTEADAGRALIEQLRGEE